MIRFIHSKLSKQGGFTFIELILGLSISVLLLSLISAWLLQWGLGWKKGCDQIIVEQNGRMAFAALTEEIKYHAGYILVPEMGEDASYIKFRDEGNYRTMEFYCKEKEDDVVLYRYILADNNYSPGINPMTDSTQVSVEQLKFRRITNNIVEIDFTLKHKYSQIEKTWKTMVVCKNHI